MVWQETLYTIPLIVIAAISTISGLYVWRHRVPWAKTVALLILAGAEWMLGSVLEMGSADLLTKIFWDKVQYLGMVIVPTAWLVFALRYTGREKWLTRRTLALLSIVPLITLLLVFTNEAHGLIWSRIVLDADGPFLPLDETFGVWFWVYVVYSYVLLLIATFLLIRTLIRSHHFHRWQASLLLFGAFVPWLGSALMLSGLNPFPHLDLTPLAFAVTSPVLVWTLVRLRMGDVVPVARDHIIEGMSDGVIVLDALNRIVDLNPVAQHLIGDTVAEVIGQRMEQIWPEWPDQMEHSRDMAEVGKEVVLDRGDGPRTYDVRISPQVDWRGRLTSQVIVLRDMTKRKRVDQELKMSRQSLQKTYDAIPDAVVSTDVNFDIVSCNESVQRILGYTPDELVGKNYSILVAEEMSIDPGQKERQGELFEKGYLEKEDFYFKRKSGEIFPVSFSVALIKDKQGKPVGAVSTIRDITKRKRAEEALRESEERFRTIFESTREGMITSGPDGRILSVNPATAAVLGYKSPEELVGMSAIELYADPEQRKALFDELMEKGYAEDREITLVKKDGTPIYVLGSATLHRDNEGNILRTEGIFMDITERKRAEEALGKSEERFRSLSASAAVGIFLIDAQGQCIYTNARLQAIAGLTLEESLGHGWNQMVHPDDREAALGEASKRASEGGELSREFRIVTPQGELHWVHVHSTAMLSQGGKQIGRVGTVQDITDRKRAKEALRESEEKYRNIVETAPDGIVTVSLKGIVTSCNSAFANITGFSKSEIVGKHFSKMPTLRARDIPEYMKLFNSLIRGKVPKPFEIRWLHKDGTAHWAELLVSLMKKGRKIIGLQAIARDITERKRADEELRKSEEKLKTITESINDVIFQLSPTGFIQYVSPRVETWGYKPEDLIGKHLKKTTPLSELPKALRVLKSVLSGEVINDLEINQIDGGGNIIPVEMSVAPVKKEGKIIALQGVMRDIIERKRAEEEISHRSKQLALINEVGHRIAPILELTELYQTVVEAVQEKLGYQYVALFSVRDDEVALEAVAGLQTKSLPSGYTQKMGEGMVGWVAQSGQTLLANDVTKEPRFLSLEFLEIAAELDVPIRLDSKTIGVLTVDSDRPNIFTQADVTTLETVAAQVARAIENARLYEEAQARSTYLETLQRINATLRSTLPLSQVLETIVQGTAEALDYVGSFIAIPDATGERLTLGAAWGGRILDAALRLTRFKLESCNVPLKVQENLIVRAFVTGELQVSSGKPEGMAVGAEPSISAKTARAMERIAGARGAACVPLRVAEKTVGVLIIVSPRQQLGDEERAMLLGLADQAGLAIENAGLYEETQARSAYLATLLRINATLRSTLPLNQVLKTIAQGATEALDYIGSTISVPDAKGERLVLGAMWGGRFVDAVTRLTGFKLESFSLPLKAEENPIVRAYLTGELQAWSRAPERIVVGVEPPLSPKLARAIERAMGAKLAACVPLRAAEKAVGVLTVFSPREQLPDEKRAMLLGLADQAGLAIENARLYEETQARSDELAALNAIAMTVTSTLDLQEVLRAVQETVMKLLGEKYPLLFALFNERNQTFEVVLTGVQREPLRRVEKLLGAKFEELHVPLSTMNPAVREAILAGKPYVTGDSSDLLGPLVSRRLVQVAQKAMGVESIVDLPLSAKGKLVGTMVLFSPKETIPDEEMELLSAIANQAATAIDNARLYREARDWAEKIQRMNERLMTLREISYSMTETLSPKDVLQRIADGTLDALECSAVWVLIVNPKDNTLHSGAMAGLPGKMFRSVEKKLGVRLSQLEVPIKEGVGPMVDAILHGEAKIVQSLRELSWSPPLGPLVTLLEKGLRIGPMALIPLITKGKPVGVVIAARRRDRVFLEEEIQFFQTFASQAATAIENAGLFEEVERTRDYLENLIESSPDAIVTADRQGRITLFSKGAESIFGYKASEVLAQPLSNYYLDSREGVRIMRRLLREGRLRNYETQVIDKNGKAIPTILSASLLRDEEGAITGTLGIIKDHTDRKGLEEELRRYTEHLEERVEERTEALSRLNEQLEKANRLKSDFVSAVSHELRAPLFAIVGMSEMLLDRGVEDHGWSMEYLQMINEQGNRLARLIDDLLDLSRIESGKQVYQWESVHMGEVIRESIQFLKAQAEEKGIAISRRIEKGLPSIEADRDKMRQVLINLISNSLNYSDEGAKVKVFARQLTVHRGPKRGEKIVAVSVTDTGWGIPPEDLPHIFEKFYRGKEHQRHTRGSGLGLALVKEIVAAHGGTIEAKSKVGKGTKFTVKLPLAS